MNGHLQFYRKFIRFSAHALQKPAPCLTREQLIVNGKISIGPKCLLTHFNERVTQK